MRQMLAAVDPVSVEMRSRYRLIRRSFVAKVHNYADNAEHVKVMCIIL